MMKNARSVLLCLLAVSTLMLSACASYISDEAAAEDREARAITTGSIIPRKSGSSEAKTVGKDQFESMRAPSQNDPSGK
jgi:hypothetical protein